jgi:ABC-2 type transport system ATP-binding protein/sodium transport system ATP-binding protein
MINLNQLCKTFVTADREIKAADHVSFEVQPGEVFGLLGPNGAGKTTVMRMILGLLKPDAGSAEINGISSSNQPDELKRQVGFVSASAGVYQWLTGREMLAFFGEAYGIADTDLNPRINQLADVLKLNDFIDRGCATLSTGQKQRLSLARALVHDPPVMILDEPTLGLDVVGSQVIFDYIDHLKQRDKIVILCTHRLEQAQRVCSRFGLLHEGKMVATGTLADLQNQTGHQDLVSMFINLLDDQAGFPQLSPGEST